MLLPLAGGTVDIVGYPLSPTVSPLVSLAEKAFWTAAVYLWPGVRGPQEVVDLGAPLLDDEKSYPPSLVILFLLGPHAFG